MKSPRVGTVKTFQPVLMDRMAGHLQGVQPGTKVRVIQPHSCPKNGTMGQCYVEDATTGTFIGMVCINSLT